MFTCAGGTIHLRAILKPDRDGIATGKAHDLFHTFAVPSASDHDRLNGASCIESFSYGMDAGDFFHKRKIARAS